MCLFRFGRAFAGRGRAKMREGRNRIGWGKVGVREQARVGFRVRMIGRVTDRIGGKGGVGVTVRVGMKANLRAEWGIVG